MVLAYEAATLRDAMLEAITTRAGNAALLRIYDGSRPAMGGTARNLLAELNCGSPFAGAAVMRQALYWITITMTILSGLHYTYLGLTILQAGFGNNSKRDG